MELISSSEQNGYIINKYDNGTIEKFLKPLEVKEVLKPQLSQQEISNAQILNKLDYIECLSELNSMKGGNL